MKIHSCKQIWVWIRTGTLSAAKAQMSNAMFLEAPQLPLLAPDCTQMKLEQVILQEYVNVIMHTFPWIHTVFSFTSMEGN